MNRLVLFKNLLFLCQTILCLTLFQVFMILKKKPFWKHWVKRQKCWLPTFYPFPIMFSSYQSKFVPFEPHINCRLQMLSIWTRLKFCRISGKGILFTRWKNYRVVQIDLSICRQQRWPKEWEVFLDRVENIVGKGENSGYQHLLLLPQCF